MEKQPKLLIIDDVPGQPLKAFTMGPDLKLLPSEMWPDGKVRLHKVKTAAGETVWLTDGEFDSLVLAARHRYYANKVGPSARPRPALAAGESVHLRFTDKNGTWSVFATVRKVKGDGRVIVEHGWGSSKIDRGDGVTVRVNDVEYDVLRASGGTFTIRLRQAAA